MTTQVIAWMWERLDAKGVFANGVYLQNPEEVGIDMQDTRYEWTTLVKESDLIAAQNACLEQARLLGMSVERELSLHAKIQKMQGELEEKTKTLQFIESELVMGDEYAHINLLRSHAGSVLDKYNNI